MSAASAAALSGVHFRPHDCHSSTPPTSIAVRTLHASSPNPKFLSLGPRRLIVSCNSGTRPGGSSSGDNDSKNVLDAFFLGKALGEAIGERIESTIGELLSTVGRLQAEQQKQVQDFQDEVFERAKRAKEKAAGEAMEAQGLITKSSASAANKAQVLDGKASPTSSSSFSQSKISPKNNNSSTSGSEETNGKFEDPSLSISIED